MGGPEGTLAGPPQRTPQGGDHRERRLFYAHRGSEALGCRGRDLLSRAISIKSFKTRDEQEVAGYAEAMDLVFEAYADLRLTENHFANFTRPCCVTATRMRAIAAPTRRSPTMSWRSMRTGREIGVVFETTSPFDTPREMEALVAWTRKALDEEALTLSLSLPSSS